MDKSSGELNAFMSEIQRVFPQGDTAESTFIAENNNTPRFHRDTSYLMDSLHQPVISPEIDISDTERTQKAALNPSYSPAESSDLDLTRMKGKTKQSASTADLSQIGGFENSPVCLQVTCFSLVLLLCYGVSISLNTFLALFTTLAKAGIVYPVYNCIGQLKWIWFSDRTAPLDDFVKFDEASRGIWGGVGLIRKLRGVHIASVGAFVSSMAIGVSPITQQVIAYESRLVVSTTQSLSAQVSTSNYFAGSVSSGTRGYYVSVAMQQAINFAQWSNSTEQILPISPTCPTGNCTWPEYDSLAICSSVTNVTHLLNITTPKDLPKDLPNSRIVSLSKEAVLDYGVDVSSIVSDSTVWTDYQDKSRDYLAAHEYNIIYEISAGVMGRTGPAHGPQFNALKIVSCWCVNTYNTSTINGIASTNITATSSKFYDPRPPFGVGRANISIAAPKGSANYSVDSVANSALRELMVKRFNGTYEGWSSTMDQYTASDVSYIIQPMLEPNNSALVLERISNYSRNMATSMSNSIRTHVGDGLTPHTNYIDGTSWVMETYIHIRWGWISLLGGLIVLSTIFLLATMFKTKRLKVEAMRSSSLAAMTILSPEAKAYMGSTALQEGSIMRSEGLKLRLRRGSVGWTLDRVS